MYNNVYLLILLVIAIQKPSSLSSVQHPARVESGADECTVIMPKPVWRSTTGCV